jgi:SAM-dependent methyltransferase
VSVLDQKPRDGLREFADLLRTEGLVLDADRITAMARDLIAFYGRSPAGRDEVRAAPTEILDLERRWYESLATGAPDFGIYATDAYLADLWACWVLYSRRYLRGLRKAGLLDDLDGRSIADLGCGIGQTTAAWRELLPAAHVVGTNVDGTIQTRLARRMGDRYGFDVLHGPPERTDVVFASEYFEHFEEPVAHLRAVLATGPRVLFVASTFGPRSPGHFEAYRVDGDLVSPRQASRAFDAELVARGFERVRTGLWNNRPTYWRRDP